MNLDADTIGDMMQKAAGAIGDALEAEAVIVVAAVPGMETIFIGGGANTPDDLVRFLEHALDMAKRTRDMHGGAAQGLIRDQGAIHAKRDKPS